MLVWNLLDWKIKNMLEITNLLVAIATSFLAFATFKSIKNTNKMQAQTIKPCLSFDINGGPGKIGLTITNKGLGNALNITMISKGATEIATPSRNSGIGTVQYSRGGNNNGIVLTTNIFQKPIPLLSYNDDSCFISLDLNYEFNNTEFIEELIIGYLDIYGNNHKETYNINVNDRGFPIISLDK